jgi:hypothetical protein
MPTKRLASCLSGLGQKASQVMSLNSKSWTLRKTQKCSGTLLTELNAVASNSFPSPCSRYDTYKNARLFLSEDKESGFALIGDEIGSFFSGVKVTAYPTLRLAVEQGGRRIDAYRTVMPTVLGRQASVLLLGLSSTQSLQLTFGITTSCRTVPKTANRIWCFVDDHRNSSEGNGQEEAAKTPLRNPNTKKR